MKSAQGKKEVQRKSAERVRGGKGWRKNGDRINPSKKTLLLAEIWDHVKSIRVKTGPLKKKKKGTPKEKHRF